MFSKCKQSSSGEEVIIQDHDISPIHSLSVVDATLILFVGTAFFKCSTYLFPFPLKYWGHFFHIISSAFISVLELLHSWPFVHKPLQAVPNLNFFFGGGC